MNDLASKMYLFGLGCLLSCNYYQASIYMAIFTYFTMVAVILLTVLSVISTVS